MSKIYKDDWDVTATGKIVFSIDYEALKEHKDWIDLFKQETYTWTKLNIKTDHIPELTDELKSRIEKNTERPLEMTKEVTL